MATKTSSGLAETIKTLVYAVVIALFIRTFFYEPFSIPSASMVPTLLVGDYLFVAKFSYGYSRYSLPFGLPLIPGPGRVFFRSPARGDVIVFKLPRDPSIDFIKRVVGLPGDRIQVKDNVLSINDTPVKMQKVEPYFDNEGGMRTFSQYVETLPDGRRHSIIELGTTLPLDNTAVFTVPAGHYFMMGDNRDNSADSRDAGSGVGYVPAENLVGRAEFIFFSTDGYARWWEIWKWPFTIRYDRLLTAIH
ncbi:MAG TPA: signal peptidase I [Stellaceae bacterium]|nr:signal peptidase I [Stellaceae bacterium]